jgi:hypothetical protein
MPLRSQFACLLTALFAMLVGVSTYQHSSAGEGRTLAWLELPVARDYYEDDLRREKELAKFDGVLLARSEERYAIVIQLSEGRLSLFEAAAAFKRLNSLPSPSNHNCLWAFPGASDDERVCRQVICWLAVNTYQLPPSQRQIVLDRLEAELRDQLKCAGTVVLPGV